MPVPTDPTYSEVARHIQKYDHEKLLREIARMAAREANRKMAGASVEIPETAFAFAAVARTAIAEARATAISAGLRSRRRKKGRGTRTPGPDQVRRLCDEMIRVWSPEHMAAASTSLGMVLAPFAFEQFGQQWSAMENLARAHSLFADAHARHPDLPDSAAWADVLGVNLDGFMRTGFGLYVAMLQNEGQVSRDVLARSDVRPIWEPLSPAEVFTVVDNHFAQEFVKHHAISADAQKPGWEKWSFNSLTARPLITFGNDLVAPIPHFLVDRISSTGLWYIGQEAWGTTFTDAVGGAFEDYVGQNLDLISAAIVLPEIKYSTPTGDALSCDWFVVTDEAVILVEVKCARPLFGSRTGEIAAFDDADKKIGKAVQQLESTAGLIKGRHPAFAGIPRDRPLLGLVVTLEPHYLRETARDDILESAVLPISIAWAHELENATAQLRTAPDAGRQLLEALTPNTGPLKVSGSLSNISRSKDAVKNPIVDASWDAWATWPAIDRLGSRPTS
ncbi:hypothetical protein V5H98_14375 [Georgenia sp. M64]|uniref:hypothetical protein n=1 Tax=Georgenia sp. M64 TaxID=3120520 RepID=UPI0030E0CBD8